MDTTGQLGVTGESPAALRRRELPLQGIALAGSLLAWIMMFVISVSVAVWHARDAVRTETASAFMLVKSVATVGLPTAFRRQDVMAEASRLATEIRAQRHVTAELRDAAGRPVELPPRLPESLTDPPQVPEWFARFFRPPPMQDVFPITQYPNVLGVLEIRTEPSDRIAEIWRDLSVLVPLLLVTGLATVGATLLLGTMIKRRLDGITAAVGQMRTGQLGCLAPPGRLVELNALGDGINALATHLADERAENRLLQGRILTLAEAERARIASDLHDEIGPQLFALGAAIEQARRHIPEPERAGSLTAIATHAEAIRKSARNAIDDLRPGPETSDLGDMLQEMLIDFEDAAPGIRFQLSLPPALPEIGESGRIALYRFLRESVLNALRHARPGVIGVVLEIAGQTLVARVSDDGEGPPTPGRRGLGHLGMRDRAAAIGAVWLPPERREGRTVTEFRIPLS